MISPFLCIRGDLMNKLDFIKNVIFFSIALILLYYVFTLFHILDVFLYIFHLFLPIFIALFFHLLLEPIIQYMSSERLERKIVVIHLYLSFSLLFLIACYFLAPYILEQCLHFYKQYCDGSLYIHPLLKSIYDFLQQYQILDHLILMFNGWTQSLFYWIGQILLALGISFYLSYDNIHLLEKCIAYLPFDKQGICMQTLKKLKLITYQFIKSMFLDFIVFFLMCFFVFFFIDENLVVWIALFLAITNLIPYVGPYIGGIPVVIYEYIQNPQYGYYALIAILVLQYIESSYLQPYLFSKSIKLHPIALFIALTFFGDFFGLIGMIFSPLFLSYLILLIKMLQKLHVMTSLQKMIYKVPHDLL